MTEDWYPRPGDVLIVLLQMYLMLVNWAMQHGAGLW